MNDTAVEPCVTVIPQWYLSDTAVIVMHLLLTCFGMASIGEEHWGRCYKVKRYRKIIEVMRKMDWLQHQKLSVSSFVSKTSEWEVNKNIKITKEKKKKTFLSTQNIKVSLNCLIFFFLTAANKSINIQTTKTVLNL